MAAMGLFCVCVVALLTTYANGQTLPPEKEERGDIRYYYDPASHYFTMVTHSSCYMVPLTHAERDHVHTSHGIESLELSMMRDWLGVLSETKIYHTDSLLPVNIRSWCNRHDIYLMDRVSTPSSTANTIIG